MQSDLAFKTEYSNNQCQVFRFQGKCCFLSVYYTTQGIQMQWSNVGHFSKPQIWDYSPEYLYSSWQGCPSSGPASNSVLPNGQEHCSHMSSLLASAHPPPLPRCNPMSESLEFLSCPPFPCSPDPNHQQVLPYWSCLPNIPWLGFLFSISVAITLTI